jgi:hypothetical protein
LFQAQFFKVEIYSFLHSLSLATLMIISFFCAPTARIFSGGRPEAGGFSAASRTVDGCFWLALLASPQENQATHNQAVRQALDGASDGVVRANDDSGPSDGVEVFRSNDDPGPSGRGIFSGRAGSALQAKAGGRSGLPKGRMAESDNAGMVAAYTRI